MSPRARLARARGRPSYRSEQHSLEARVYSSWKGHGKDAEKAYDTVVADHPSDFRGYLAQGVFYRTVGKPDAAENAFRKAKSLAPADTAGVVNQVIAASKSSK